MVGNEFIMPTHLHVAAPPAKIDLARDEIEVPVIPVEAISQLDIIPVSINDASSASHFSQWLDVVHSHSFIVFMALFLLVAASGIEVGGRYLSARINVVKSSSIVKHSISGLNLSVPAAQLPAKLQAVTTQTTSLTVGSTTVSISPDTIKSWLKITPSKDKSQDYIHINGQVIGQSLAAMANKFVSSPVNQVSVTHNGVSQIVVAGQNGAKLTDPSTLVSQAASAAKTVMDGKGLNFSTPLLSQPFQAVTPADFSKLIEVNVDTHQMYLYDNGNLTSTYSISAGSPLTPTPIGEFHIWEKLALQTMTGYNPNGTRYIQPNVHWINYFDHSGDAIHGNYWRPLSVFGTTNTSHGCVSLPDDQAEAVYNWAPIGTPVITHHS